MSAAKMAGNARTSQVRLRLKSCQPDLSLPETTGTILVDTDLHRNTLSKLVNGLLETEKPIPFDFLINGSFLRTSLDQYLTSNGISSETILNIEYDRAIDPPLYLSSFEHDAWVSSVDILSATSKAGQWAGNAAMPMPGHERIVSGSFDGALRIWNMSGEVLVTSTGNKEPAIKTAKFLSASQAVSSGDDGIVRIWNYREEDDGMSAALSLKLELCGHKRGVSTVAVHQPSSRILSASADSSVGLWSTRKSDAPAVPVSEQTTGAANKKRRLGNPSSVAQRGPLLTMSGHSDCVSSAIFAPNDASVGYSTSWDHSVKTWDLATSTAVDTRTTSASLFSLTSLSPNLLAAGSSDKYIALIDPRASATTVAVMTLRGHKNSVVALAPDPHSSYGLISGSYDGTCRIWDIRSSDSGADGRLGKSIYTIGRESAGGQKPRAGGEGVKVFDVQWDEKVGIVSASEDKRVQINRGKMTNDTQDIRVLA